MPPGPVQRTGKRQPLAWPMFRQNWPELMAGLVLSLGLLAIWQFQNRWTPAQIIGLWGLVLTAVAVLIRRGWNKIFGPVLFYDMIRMSRRSRYISLRIVYAGLLLLAFCWQHSDMLLAV